MFLRVVLPVISTSFWIQSWRAWENEAHMDIYNTLGEIKKALPMRRKSTFVRVHTSNPMDMNRFLVWVFGRSVFRADYLSLRQGFFAVGRSNRMIQELHLCLRMTRMRTRVHSNIKFMISSIMKKYYDFVDDSIRNTSEGNLFHTTVVSSGSYDASSASQPEDLKPEYAEVAHGNQ